MTLLRPPNPFLDKMTDGRIAVGTFVFSRDPAVTEIIGGSGFDLAVIDIEHAPLTICEVVEHVRAAHACGMSSWVRVAGYDAAEIGRILDTGAQGIILPHFGLHPEEYRIGLEAMRYAPAGARPTCTGVRACGYGTGDFTEYVTRSNRETLAIGLIEDGEVVDRIDEVLDECEIGAVMPGGAGDLASSLGLHGQGRHPRVVGAARSVVEAAKRRSDIRVGVYISELTSVEEWCDLGVDFLIYSIDYKVMAKAFGEACSTIIEQIPATGTAGGKKG